MIKNYVLDTNVVVHAPAAIYSFEDNQVILPIILLEELDNLKKKDGLVGYQARTAIKVINDARQYGNIHEGLTLPNGGMLKVELNHMTPVAMPDGMDFNKNDNKIISIAKNIQTESAKQGIRTILVTKDLCMAIKAESLGLEVEDYLNDKVDVDNLYQGYRDVTLSTQQIDQIYENGLTDLSEIEPAPYPNEFFCIKSFDVNSHETIARYDGQRLIPLKFSADKAWGLVPRNREQRMALELLQNSSIHFVSILGSAGTGKTLLAIAVALQKVLEEGLYNKIIYVKPVVSAGDAIGFLPGTERKKLKPFMDSFGDALESLMNDKKKASSGKGDKLAKRKNKTTDEKPTFNIENFLEQYADMGIIEMKTFAFMRGRTLNNAMVIIDEAQQITPHLAKLMLTRAGQNAKFVMLGDASDNQIDNMLIDSRSNGLVYVVDKMRPSPITGHLTLQEVERSPLARAAEELL